MNEDALVPPSIFPKKFIVSNPRSTNQSNKQSINLSSLQRQCSIKTANNSRNVQSQSTRACIHANENRIASHFLCLNQKRVSSAELCGHPEASINQSIKSHQNFNRLFQPNHSVCYKVMSIGSLVPFVVISNHDHGLRILTIRH